MRDLTDTVWDKAPVKGAELLLLLAIADAANSKGELWHSQAKLAERARMSRETVNRLVRRFEAVGVLEKVGSTGRNRSKWRVNEDQLQALAHPETCDEKSQEQRRKRSTKRARPVTTDHTSTPATCDEGSHLEPPRPVTTDHTTCDEKSQEPVTRNHRNCDEKSQLIRTGNRTGNGTSHEPPRAPARATPDPSQLALQAVQTTIGNSRPKAIRNALTHKTAELLAEGIPGDVITAALVEWRTRKKAGVGLLDYLVSDVMSERDAAQAPKPAPRSTTDERVAQAQALKARFRQREQQTPNNVLQLPGAAS